MQYKIRKRYIHNIQWLDNVFINVYYNILYIYLLHLSRKLNFYQSYNR